MVFAEFVKVTLRPNFHLSFFDLKVDGTSTHGSKLVPGTTKHGQLLHALVVTFAQIDVVRDLVQVVREVVPEENRLLTLHVELQTLHVHLTMVVESIRKLVENVREWKAIKYARHSFGLE